MERMKFGDLEPGTVWREPYDNDWWLKVDAKHVYGVCHKKPESHRGWGIQITGSGAKEFAGVLFWTSNDSEVVVWDGKEELK